MNYFGAHKDHSLFQLNQMLIRQGKDKGKIRIGQVAAAYLSAIEKNWKISAHDGLIDSESHTDLPTSVVFKNRTAQGPRCIQPVERLVAS